MNQPELSPRETRLIERIKDRGYEITVSLSIPTYQKRWIALDVMMVHHEICPLDLNRFADACNYEFLHDLLGIRKHLNRFRKTFKNEFEPNFTRNIKGAKSCLKSKR